MKQFTFGDYTKLLNELEQAHPERPVEKIEVAGLAYELGYQRALSRAQNRAKRAKKGGRVNELQNSCN